jgi:hypothetical protein
MIYVGIDNGLKGGIAILKDGKLFLHVMPTMGDGKKNRVDVEKFDAIIMDHAGFTGNRDIFIVYERPVGSQSVTAAVSMQDSFARVESALILQCLRREPITPQKWQKMFWKKPKMPEGQKFDTKAAALKVARQLWPDQNWLASSRCRVPHDGLVDSALLSEYCRRVYSS